MNNVANVNTVTITFLGMCITASLIYVHMELTQSSNTPQAAAVEHNECHWSSGYQRMTLRRRVKKVEYGRKTVDKSYDVAGTMNEIIDHANEEERILTASRNEPYRKLKSNWYATFNSAVQRGRFSTSYNFLTLPENDSSVLQARHNLQRSKPLLFKHSNAYDQLIHFLTTFATQGIYSGSLPPPPHPPRPSTYSSTSSQCPYVLPSTSSSSSICKKAKRHCVKFSTALRITQHLPITHTITRDHPRVQEDVYHSGYENLLSRGCREVKWEKDRRSRGDKLVVQGDEGGEVTKNIDHTNICRENRKIIASIDKEEEEEKENGQRYTPITLTIDARRSFIHELGSLTKFPRRLALDLLFDLAGLNSLHRHEVISNFLQVLRQLLLDRQYQLMRSSTDGEDLEKYLHQEDLQQPLLVNSLWQRTNCG